jgi:cyclic dehypoxanthinyl futalosine synthase
VHDDEWLDVMRAVHRVGLEIDGDDDVWDRRSDRASRQALAAHSRSTGRDGRLHAFIPVDVSTREHGAGTQIKDEPTGVDYLKMLAVSRLFLDNIENFQSSWLTQGLRLGQVALAFRRQRHGLDHD